MDTKVIFALKDMDEATKEGAKLLQMGEIVVFPTETVYGLGANALNENAVAKIFTAKGRPQDNPLIVHLSGKDKLNTVAKDISPTAKKLIDAFAPGAISFILNKKEEIASNVTCGLDSVAIRIPSNIIAKNLLLRANLPVAAPSANISGRPSPTLAKHAYEDLCGKVPLIIDGGRCDIGLESTVVDVRGDVPVILRPGKVTAQDIEKIAGKVDIGSKTKEIISPGTKYKHYAPKADVFVFYETKKELEKLKAMYYSGKKTVVLCSQDYKKEFEGYNTILLGESTEAEYSLYKALRDADEQNYQVILFYLQDAMGVAVENRILKADKRGEKN